MEQKTIKEWLETLPEPYRTQALENAKKHMRSDDYATSLEDAITRLSWFFSEYWRDLYRRATMREFNGTTDGAVVGAKNKQIGGSHYKDMKIQPSEFIRANNIGWYEANAIKYICRHQSKGKKQDIEKAIHYLEMIMSEYDEQV